MIRKVVLGVAKGIARGERTRQRMEIGAEVGKVADGTKIKSKRTGRSSQVSGDRDPYWRFRQYRLPAELIGVSAPGQRDEVAVAVDDLCTHSPVHPQTCSVGQKYPT